MLLATLTSTLCLASQGLPEPTSAWASADTGAYCTLDPGSVSAGGQSVRLPTVTYPCP